MSQLQFNITQLSQIADIDFTGAAAGDVLKIKTESPLQFEFGANGGGTGVVNSVAGAYPIYVDADPVNPTISIEVASKGDSGIVTTDAQEFSGVKTFFDIPQSINGPVVDEDIANKKYVDTFAAGLQVKDAVRAATLVAGTLGSSFQNGSIIDGVTLVTGDRILIKNQTNAVQNGIYTVNVSGAPTRATDYDTAGEANVGTFTTVTEGGQKNTQWVQINTGTPAPGTDALNFGRLNISGNVNTIQSAVRGTLTGAVTLNSDDLYYTGSTGSTLKSVLDLKVTTNTTQVITGNKTFQGTTNFTGVTTAVTQASTDNSTRIATTAFVKSVAGGSGILTLKKTLTSAQILNSFTTPITLISAQGVGTAIQVISVMYRMVYNSAPYSSVTSWIMMDTATQAYAIFSAANLSQANNGLGNIVLSANTDNIVENKALMFAAQSANPTGGNSPIDLYFTYRVVTL